MTLKAGASLLVGAQSKRLGRGVKVPIATVRRLRTTMGQCWVSGPVSDVRPTVAVPLRQSLEASGKPSHHRVGDLHPFPSSAAFRTRRNDDILPPGFDHRHWWTYDLPLNFHPAAIRDSTDVKPFGAVSVPA
jgi:hypothetical protein